MARSFRESTEDLRGSESASDEVVSQMRQQGPWRVWKNFRGCGSNCGRASEGVVSATDGVESVLEQVITATERVMSDTKTPLRISK